MLAFAASRGVPPPVRCVPRQAWRNGSASTGERTLAEEVPVAFSYDGATHAVLMATPGDFEDFALGFSYTEGIITVPADIAELAVVSVADGIVLRMWLTGDRSDAFAARRRRFVGAAGCGMCGLESLAEANRAIPMTRSDLQVSRQEIAVAALPTRQQLNMQLEGSTLRRFGSAIEGWLSAKTSDGTTRWTNWQAGCSAPAGQLPRALFCYRAGSRSSSCKKQA